jgi:hypothetical protein
MKFIYFKILQCSPYYSNGTSDKKDVSSDEEEQLLLIQPDAVNQMVNKEDKQCLLTQPYGLDGKTKVINKRGSSLSIKKCKGPTAKPMSYFEVND